MFKHSVINQSFKYFAKHWKKRNQCVTFHTLVILSTGTTLAFFLSDGKIPWFKQDLKIISNGLEIESPYNLIMRILIISWPCALLGSNLFIIILMSWGVKTEGIVLLFCINEHCPEKCSLKSSLKLEMKVLVWNRGRIAGTFLSFNIF